ncbi:hypothetical protein KKI24_08350, partial [bacterium]|nr:hypothetical protein [bacterium]
GFIPCPKTFVFSFAHNPVPCIKFRRNYPGKILLPYYFACQRLLRSYRIAGGGEITILSTMTRVQDAVDHIEIR